MRLKKCLNQIFKLKNFFDLLIILLVLSIFNIIKNDYYSDNDTIDIELLLNETARYYKNQNWMYIQQQYHAIFKLHYKVNQGNIPY